MSMSAKECVEALQGALSVAEDLDDQQDHAGALAVLEAALADNVPEYGSQGDAEQYHAVVVTATAAARRQAEREMLLQRYLRF